MVPVTVIGWLFVAPATDDDGWFATQARNAAHSGDVGNYYQLYDQSFTPFTWSYQALAWWQQLAGYAPVPQRIPALVCGLLELAGAAPVRGSLRWPPRRGPATAGRGGPPPCSAVRLLAWWLPYGMGVRPEAVVALCAAATLLAVLVAGRRRPAGAAWLACAAGRRRRRRAPHRA